jgi:hypothetical protein
MARKVVVSTEHQLVVLAIPHKRNKKVINLIDVLRNPGDALGEII